MTEIFLNGQRAWPSSSASFKLTVENPYFTKTSSYTLDVEFPLSIDANRAIFGWLDRIDISKPTQTLDCELWIDGTRILLGQANVTSVTQSSVKLQLLGESAAYNYRNKVDNLYVDELDLGSIVDYSNRADKWNPLRSLSDDRYGAQGVTYVMYPVRNTTLDLVVNAVYHYKNRDSDSYDYGIGIDMSAVNDSQAVGDYARAFQPMMWWIVKLVAHATGFPIADADNQVLQNPFFRKIFLANTSDTAAIASMLPHWTVGEFWTEIENFFGLVLDADLSARTLTLKSRAQYFATADVVNLGSVVDEYSTELDDDSQADLSSSNVGYADHDSGPEDQLSEYILTNAQFCDDYPTVEELLAYGSSQGSVAMSLMRNVIWRTADGRQYIYSDSEAAFVEVNMLRPCLTHNEDTDLDIELKIAPARYGDYDYIVTGSQNGSGQSKVHGTDTAYEILATIPTIVAEVPGPSEINNASETSHIVIEDLISGDEDEDSDSNESSDIMYVAITNYGSFDQLTATIGNSARSFQMPRPLLRERTVAAIGGTVKKNDSPYSLSLISISGQTNMASNTIENAATVDVKNKYCIKFISDTIPDVKSVFLIRNRRFVCEKIEATIKPKGLDKLLTGYFYELT